MFIVVCVSTSRFAEGVRFCKSLGGVYNPKTKKWTLPLTEWKSEYRLKGLVYFGEKTKQE